MIGPIKEKEIVMIYVHADNGRELFYHHAQCHDCEEWQETDYVRLRLEHKLNDHKLYECPAHATRH